MDGDRPASERARGLLLFAGRQEIADAREAFDPRLRFAGNQQAALGGAIDFETVALAGGDARQ